MRDIEELQQRHPELAARMIALAQELVPLGGRLKIDMPGNNTPQPTPVTPLLDVEPVEGELTRDQIASGLRATVTVLGAILGTLGVTDPQRLPNWINQNFAVILSIAIVLVPRVWSWLQAKHAVLAKAQAIEVALKLPQNAVRRRDGAPLTPTNVAKITAELVKREKQAEVTPVEALIDERIRLAGQEKVIAPTPVERVVRNETKGEV